MPELPEVETTRLGLQCLAGQRVLRVQLCQPRLRHPVDPQLPNRLPGQACRSLERRGKYLLMQFDQEWLVWHLGMSGSMRLDSPNLPLRKHDHLLIDFSGNLQLRYHDPRRFGCVLACTRPDELAQLAGLGPEPLSDAFSGEVLFGASRGRTLPIKQLIMNAAVVVGVGNIYANEALFAAGIDPRTSAGKISRVQAHRLVEAIKACLIEAIAKGGTTLKDFVNSCSEPGYFQLSLCVYGRQGQACPHCATPIRSAMLGQRSTFWCPGCQRKRGVRQRHS